MDQVFAPETAILRPVLPFVAAAEVEVSDMILPLVRELAVKVAAVEVPV